MYEIISMVAPTKTQTLAGLDNISVKGKEAIAKIIKILESYPNKYMQQIDILKRCSLILKQHYEEAITPDVHSECSYHCLSHAFGICDEEAHEERCDLCEGLKLTLTEIQRLADSSEFEHSEKGLMGSHVHSVEVMVGHFIRAIVQRK
jgi:hypothetical protein